MLPQQENRRGCYLIAALVIVVLAILLWISSEASDSAQVNEAVGASTAAPSDPGNS